MSNKIFPRPQVRGEQAVVLSNADILLDDALSVIEKEILRYKHKVNHGSSLLGSEAKTLQGYIKSLVELSREQRERAKSDDFSKLSDEELLQMLQDSVAKKKSLQGSIS